jgi:hypothetical protein
MLSLVRSFTPRTLSRSIAQRAATLHTLPDLPYAYNVKDHTPGLANLAAEPL